MDLDLALRAVLIGCGAALLWAGLKTAETLFGYRQAPERKWRTLAFETLLLVVTLMAMISGMMLALVGLFGDVEVR